MRGNWSMFLSLSLSFLPLSLKSISMSLAKDKKTNKPWCCEMYIARGIHKGEFLMRQNSTVFWPRLASRSWVRCVLTEVQLVHITGISLMLRISLNLVFCIYCRLKNQYILNYVVYFWQFQDLEKITKMERYSYIRGMLYLWYIYYDQFFGSS